MNPSIARRLWMLLEPYHAAVYFAPEAAQIYGDAGTKGYWMGYFASRSAAMGAVGPGVVTATFFNFSPGMVQRAIPDAWSYSTPQRMLAARLHVADTTLRNLVPDAVTSQAVSEAADLAMAAVAEADASGRPLFAAHADLDVPEPPHLRLWHAATCLREHRGDGHIAMLLTTGLDGCEANVLAAAAGAVPADVQASRRGWSPEEWGAAAQRLRERGLLDAAGEVTASGTRVRDAVEAQTDVLASQPYEALGDDAVTRLEECIAPIARAMAAAGAMPYPNPVGVPSAF